MAKEAFEEARRCFLSGEYLAAIILCETVLEHTFAGYLHMEGRNDAESLGFSPLLEMTYEKGFVSTDEYRALRRLSGWRNAYVHYRGPAHQEHIMQRVLRSAEELYVVMRKDAVEWLTIMHRILARMPFSVPDYGSCV